MSGLLDGVLPWIFSQGDTMKRNLRGNVRSLLEDPRGYAQSIGQDIAAENARKSQAAKALLYPSVMDEQGQQQAIQAMTETALNLLAPTVYHGSPHKFDKFDSSKIGTGEGAQAYGHGLYFAEKPQVAMEYKKNLSYKDAVKQFRQELPDDADFEEVLALAASGQVSAPKARVIKELAANDWLGFDYPAQAITAAFRDKAGFHDMTPSLRKAIDEYGNLYKVDLPDSMAAKMLDWDKPLSQQPEAVKRYFEPMVLKMRSELSRPAPGWGDLSAPQAFDPTGKELLSLLRSDKLTADNILKNGLDASVSQRLGASGIPGIRYLDAGSRGAGNGSYNYVVFPGGESQLKILERNGKGLLDR